jgi:hypothetical protein
MGKYPHSWRDHLIFIRTEWHCARRLPITSLSVLKYFENSSIAVDVMFVLLCSQQFVYEWDYIIRQGMTMTGGKLVTVHAISL